MEFGLDGDTAHPPQVELMVLEPERLKCRIVLEKEANIGRLSKCELQIDDHSVSRMHARVRLRGDGQYEVEDLDSHNGTIVNGDKVSRAVLDFGDEILLGIVRLRFGLPSGSTPDDISEMGVPETEEPRPFKFNRTHMAVVVSVLLFVVTVGIVAWKQDSVGGDNYSQWFQGKSFPEFKKGVRAFSLRNWDQAFEYFQEARRMEPDREYIVDYLDAIDRERVAAENLMLAKKARDAREFASAQRLAQKAAGSIYSRGDAKEVLKAIELSAKMQFTRGRQMLLSGNLDGAIEVLEGVVKLLPEWGEAKSTLLYAKSLRNSSK